MKIFLLKIADPSDQFAIHMVSLYACERACFLEERGGGGEEEEGVEGRKEGRKEEGFRI